MKLAFSLLLGGLLLATATAQAQTGQTSFTLVGHGDAGYYFTLEGATEKNPTLVVPANTQITITLKGAGTDSHNVCFNANSACSTGGDGSGYVTGEAETATLTFNSGATGGDYWCLPHKGSGMAGKVQVAGATTTPPTDGGNKSPGLEVAGVAVALVGAAVLLAQRRTK